MSTRATISFKQEDGHYTAIYLHFDGYPDYAGKVLKENYHSIESARSLVKGGDIRSLANDGTPERFNDGRLPAVMPNRAALYAFARNCEAEYVYLFENDRWECMRV